MNAFEFATATRIVFGAGALKQAAGAAKGLGRNALVLTGKSTGRAVALLAALEEAGLSGASFSIPDEPTTEIVKAGVQQAEAAGSDVIVAIGGGSVIDAGKAISALLTNKGELLDYLEVVGKGRPLEEAPAPFIAIPTTAGTGAEVTRNAVLSVPEQKVKVSLRSPMMFPRLAIVDPELTYGLPPQLTAFTGLDALTQLIEAYVSIRANPMTDGFCLEGLPRAARFLRLACTGNDPEARENMALASLFSGLALANAGLGAVHGFAAPIGGMFHAPHGAVCAALLPHVMEANLRALKERQANPTALRRFETIARILTGKDTATAEHGVRWIVELCAELKIPSLRAYRIQPEDVPEIARKAAAASSMKGNPLPLNEAERERILRAALGS